METKISKALGTALLLLTSFLVKAQGVEPGGSCGLPVCSSQPTSLPQSVELNLPSTLAGGISINLEDYIDVNEGTLSGGGVSCESETSIGSSNWNWSLSVTNASSNSGDFSVNNSTGYVYLPTNPNSQAISFTLNVSASPSLRVKDNRLCYRTTTVGNCASAYLTCYTVQEWSGLGYSDAYVSATQNGSGTSYSFSTSKTITIYYQTKQSLTPGSGYTNPGSTCDNEGITVSITSPNFGSTYKVRSAADPDIIAGKGEPDFGGGIYTVDEIVLSYSDLQETYNSSGYYEFIVTEQTNTYYEEIDNSASKRQKVYLKDPVATGDINGEDHICLDDENQSYNVASGNEGYEWDCTNCSFVGGQTSNVVNLTWDTSKSSGQVKVRGYKNSDSGKCYTSWETKNISFEHFSSKIISGSDFVCNGENTGTIEMTNGELGDKYNIYRGADNLNQEKTGSGTKTWSSLEEGIYTIYVNRTGCGEYEIGSHVINERSVPSEPNEINGTANSVCSGENSTFYTSTSSASVGWGWETYTNEEWLTVDGVDESILIGQLTGGTEKVRARFYHLENGIACPSAWREKEVNIIQIPEEVEIDGQLEDICVNNEIQSYDFTTTANFVEWEAYNGTPSSGIGTSAEITWDKTASAWSLKVRGINTDGSINCEGNWITHLVNLRKDVTVYDIEGTSEICESGLGSITLTGSQTNYDYYLFKNEDMVPDSKVVSSGRSITWGSLDEGSYSVRLNLSGCGWYEMGDFSIIKLPKPDAPVLVQEVSRCGSGEVEIVVQGNEEGEIAKLYDAEEIIIDEVAINAFGSATFTTTVTSTYKDFTAVLVNDDGCSSEEINIEVEIKNAVLGDIENGVFCAYDENKNLLDMVSDKSGTFDNSDYIFDQTYVNFSALPSGVHNFNYNLVNDNGCEVKGSVQLEIKALPNAPIIESVYNICTDDEVSIVVQNYVGGNEYSWFRNNQLFHSGKELVVDGSSSFDFHVVVEDYNECLSSSINSSVSNEAVEGEIIAVNGNTGYSGEFVEFTTTAEGVEYEWLFTGDYTSYDRSPVMYFNLPDMQIDAELKVTNEYGCEGIISAEGIITLIDANNEFGHKLEDRLEEMSTESRVLVNSTSLKLYPMPSSGESVSLAFYSTRDEDITVTVQDLSLKTRVSNNLTVTKGDNTLQIPTSEIGAGYYIVQITGEQFTKPVYIYGIKQ